MSDVGDKKYVCCATCWWWAEDAEGAADANGIPLGTCEQPLPIVNTKTGLAMQPSTTALRRCGRWAIYSQSPVPTGNRSAEMATKFDSIMSKEK
mgnify:CR=1 FL=1